MANLSNVSEENRILREIQATHANDVRVVDTTPIVEVVEEILRRANLSVSPDSASEGAMELVADVLQQKLGTIPVGPRGTVLEALAVDIQKICCEVIFDDDDMVACMKFSCNCNGGDLHKSTIEVLGMLGNYSWDAKVVITMAAFAVSYGELWLVTLLGLANHPLAKSIAVLRQTPELGEINGVLKPQFETLNDLLKAVLDVSKTLIKFSSLPTKYMTYETAPLASSMNQIAWATYWSIRSVIACGARITSNIGITSGLVSSAAEAWDLSSLTHKETSLHDQLRQKLELCCQYIDEKRMEEAYENVVRVYQTPQEDNLRLLNLLIHPKNDNKPLVKISPKTRSLLGFVIDTVLDIVHLPKEGEVNVEKFNLNVLKRKTVLFFISDLDVSEEELAILDRIYKESRQRRKELQYEIVWLPIVDDQMTENMECKFKELQYKMSWYTLSHPSLLDDVSKRVIKENMGFVKKQMIVALDPVGNQANQDAYQMMLIWGNSAYPFTKVMVEELWKNETWKPEFLIASVFPEFNKWVSQSDTYVCFFGGEDIDWIKKFTTSMKEHADKTRTEINLVYIGKPNAKEAVRRIINTISSNEQIAHTLPNVTSVTYFWTRLESMLYTRMQYSGDNVDNDNIIKQIISILSFGSGHEGWAAIGKPGSDNIVQAKGDQIMASISDPKFVERNIQHGFVGGIHNTIINTPSGSGIHCNRVEFPAIAGAAVPTRVICSDCQCPMEKYILYKCCSG